MRAHDDPTPTRDRSRGEWWVVAQFALTLIIGAIPYVSSLAFPLSLGTAGRICGAVLAVAGLLLVVISARHLGSNLTPFPRPRVGSALVTDGPYGVVRHPIYLAILLIALGWSLLHDSAPAAIGALLLLAFFDLKSRREERWLVDRFPAYRLYQAKVRRLLPLVW